jgi:hypothetical protein
LHKLVVEVDSDDLAPSRQEKAAGQLTDESKPDYTNTLPEGDFGLTHTVHCDAANGRERSCLKRNVLGQLDAQIPRYVIELGVHGVAPATARDAVAGPQVTHEGADRKHKTGT